MLILSVSVLFLVAFFFLVCLLIGTYESVSNCDIYLCPQEFLDQVLHTSYNI